MSKTLNITACVALLIASTPADAAIMCDGAFQVVHGYPVSSPYCQDQDLARRLRSEGIKLSADTLRNNPTIKREACAGEPNTPACAAFTAD